MKTDQIVSTNLTSGRSLFITALIAIGAAVVANIMTRLIMGVLFDIPGDFAPLQIPAIAIFTILGTAAASLVYSFIQKRSKTPDRTFIVIAGIAFVLSILPNLGLVANPAAAPFPGGRPELYAYLIVFHVVAALVSVLVLIRGSRTHKTQ